MTIPLEKNDEFFMTEALKEASRAYEMDEVPIGAVIVCEGKIIGRSSNQMEMLKDATAHAEILAITQASSKLNNWRLDKTTLYVTKEPCLMCVGAILNTRISRVVIGTLDDKSRGVRDLIHPGYDPLLKKVTFEYGCLEEPCRLILLDFFEKARQNKRINE